MIGGQDARRQVADWMQDGREDLVLAAFDRERDEWGRDPYLVLQHGVALTRVDRLRAAEQSFQRTLVLATATDDQKAFARRWLMWLEDEWRTIAKGRAALSRARLGAGLGIGVLGALGVLGWVLARRRRVHDP